MLWFPKLLPPVPYANGVRRRSLRIVDRWLTRSSGRVQFAISSIIGVLMNYPILIGLALGASLAFPAAASAQDITIGVAGPLTGSEAVSGRQMTDGAAQAIADINAAGGVLGRRLKIAVSDDACDPKQARSVAEKPAGA